MPRRYRPEKRAVEPDLRHDNKHVSMFVNRLMKSGKKSTAQGVLYDSFALIEERVNRPAIEIFEQALEIKCRFQLMGIARFRCPCAGFWRRLAAVAAVLWLKS